MMKNKIRGVSVSLGLLGVCVVLAGCPRAPQLEVSPATLVFDAERTEQRMTLTNDGRRSLDWSLDTLRREDEASPWTETELSWLSASEESGVLEPGSHHIVLTATRVLLRPGVYRDMALRIRSGALEKIVPISLVVPSLLHVSPDTVLLGGGDLSASFNLENRGHSALDWSALYFDGNDRGVEAGELPVDMTLTPGPGGIARQTSITVQVNWMQPREDFGLRIVSPDAPGHDAVVLFRFGKPLTDLAVEPERLTVFFSPQTAGLDAESSRGPESELLLRNTGLAPLHWTIAAEARGEAIDQGPAPISIVETSGTLPAGQSDTVRVSVSEPATAIAGSGHYELVITVREQDGAVVVPLVLEAVSLPDVIASEPPDPQVARPEYELLNTLDFGRTEVQKELWVVNIGPDESRLYFRIVHEDQNVDAPLIVDVLPEAGDTNSPEGVFFLPGTNRIVNARRVVVTVDRSVMTDDVEYRNLYIEAWDEENRSRISAVPKWEVRVRVERPPMKVEGALNRSRPPFLMRFVFMLRDTLGQVIPTRTAEDLERLRFFISEDSVPLDLNEVNFWVEGPEQLKVNLVVMLDYTGSMYHAGVDDPGTPRAPGEVLEEVRDSVAMFLDDLPPGYRVALMYHNDRQPLNRLIHPFSTDRDSLKTALRNFSVPPAMHGVSDIWDALTDAVERITAEDAADTLPFDDADVRAVVFISDGYDNASTVQASPVINAARDHHVRLYPLAYNGGASINFNDLIPMAEQTGGHFYNAGTADKLVHLLGYTRSLVLRPIARSQDDLPEQVSFSVRNTGNAPLSWNLVAESEAPWISGVTPTNGVTSPGGESLVTLTVNPANLVSPDGLGRARYSINSNDGAGECVVSLALNPDGSSVQQLSVSLRDEPGRIWTEFENQLVLSYVTPLQRSAQYAIRIHYEQPDGGEITGFFEEDGMFYMGDVRAGQLSMHTTGLTYDYDAVTVASFARAEVYVRADYVPRNVNQFRMRFMPMLAEDMPPEVVDAFYEHGMTVELAPDGLLTFEGGARPNWRLIPERDGIYSVLTGRDFALPYAVSGNLLRLTFTNLWPFVAAADESGIDPEFFLDMRVDNSVYYAPQTQERPSQTVYFLYPSGPINPDSPLRVGEGSDLAAPARAVSDLASPGIDPEAPGVWDRDDDGIPDFMDPHPDDEFRPGSLVRPSTLRFNGAGFVTLTIENNRWDRVTWEASIQTSVLDDLTPQHFSWSVLDEEGNAVPLDVGEVPTGTLLPGEKTELQLDFTPGMLSGATYMANLWLNTDIFGTESTPIEVQL